MKKSNTKKIANEQNTFADGQKIINIATNNYEQIVKLVDSSYSAQNFIKSLKQISCSPEFYTLIFSIQDIEIPFETRKILGQELQDCLYGNQLIKFVHILNKYINEAKDDYETSYFLVILESVHDFIRTKAYNNFYHARLAIDEDDSISNTQLKNSILNIKKELQQIIYQSQYGL